MSVSACICPWQYYKHDYLETENTARDDKIQNEVQSLMRWWDIEVNGTIDFQMTDMTLVQGMGHQLVLITHHPKGHLEKQYPPSKMPPGKGWKISVKVEWRSGKLYSSRICGVKFVLGSKSALCEFFKMVIRHYWPFMSFASAYILTFWHTTYYLNSFSSAQEAWNGLVRNYMLCV